MNAEDTPTGQPTTGRTVAARLARELNGPSGIGFIRTLVLLNLLILFARPQYNIPVLAITELPMVLSILAALLWLTKIQNNWTTQSKTMVVILVIMAAWGPLARNNNWVFHTFRDVLQQYVAYIFPLVVFCCNARDIRRLIRLFSWIGVYLALYSLLQKGKGPGGFLDDENDLCLALLMMFPMSLTLALSQKNIMRKFAAVSALAVTMAGIVATLSRGGFVGFVVMLGYLLWRSHHIVATGFIGFLLVLGAAFLAPHQYWSEMSTIQQTDQGTAKQRRELWAVGMKVWLYPKHFLAGVGPGNIPYYLADFEPTENKSSSRTSIGGRAVHSSYVQLASELGLIGIVLFLTVVVSSYRGNVRLRAEYLRLQQQFLEIIRQVQAAKVQQPSGMDKLEHTAVVEEEPELTLEEIEALALRCSSEARFLSTFLIALNASWWGVLTAAAFISALYYPPIWVLAGFTAAVQLYSRRLSGAMRPFINTAHGIILSERQRLSVVRVP